MKKMKVVRPMCTLVSSTPLSTYSLCFPFIRILWLLQTFQLDCECMWLNPCVCANAKRALRYAEFESLSFLAFLSHLLLWWAKNKYFQLFHFQPDSLFYLFVLRFFGFLFRYFTIMRFPFDEIWRMLPFIEISDLSTVLVSCTKFINRSAQPMCWLHLKINKHLNQLYFIQSVFCCLPSSKFSKLWSAFNMQWAYIQLHTHVLHIFFSNSFSSECLSSNAFEVWQIMWILNV